MIEKEMKLLHERMKKEDPRLLALMEKCFDAGVISGKEQAQRPWVGLSDEELRQVWYDDAPVEGGTYIDKLRQVEAKLRSKNEDRN